MEFILIAIIILFILENITNIRYNYISNMNYISRKELL